jgi:integrase/recombinase XerD
LLATKILPPKIAIDSFWKFADYGNMKFNSRRRTLQVKRVESLPDYYSRLEGFMRYITHEIKLSDNSIVAYRRDMEHFFQWLGSRSLEHLLIEDFADYIAWLEKKNLAPSSRARHIASLRTFYRYLQLEGVMPDNPAKLLGSPKLWERIPRVLTRGEVEDLICTPEENSDKLWRRDRAILEFFYSTGCRCSELANLKLQDINETEGYFHCTGKGDKMRIAPLNKHAIAAFRAWMQEERETVLGRRADDHQAYFQVPDKSKGSAKGSNAVPWAFLSFKGYKLRREAIWNLVKKYANRIGIPEMSPHTLRHSFATHMLVEGADFREVQEFLGHESIMTTQLYTHHNMEHLKKVHAKCHPRG